MIVKKNKNKIKKDFSKGNLDDIEIISPNIADRVMQYADQELGLDKIINDNIDFKTHKDSIKPEIFFYGLLSSKLKRLFSISESVMAITSIPLINKLGLNNELPRGKPPIVHRTIGSTSEVSSMSLIEKF